jgi:hypothetical protein
MIPAIGNVCAVAARWIGGGGFDPLLVVSINIETALEQVVVPCSQTLCW